MNIEELITKNRVALDTENPPVAVWNNIKNKNTAPIKKFNKAWLAIAASIVVVIAAFAFLRNINTNKSESTIPGEIVIQKNDTNKKRGIDSTPQINGKDTQGVRQLSVNDTNETTKCIPANNKNIVDLASIFYVEKCLVNEIASIQIPIIWRDNKLYHVPNRGRIQLQQINEEKPILTTVSHGYFKVNNC